MTRGNAIKTINDNVPPRGAKNRRSTKFICKMEYFPGPTLSLVGAEATLRQKTRPLRVLVVKLEDEI
jgi:hypothetical protein